MMKKIKYIIPAFLLSLIVSCSDEEETGLPGSRIGVNKVSLSVTKISTFDVSKEISVQFETENEISIKTIEISKESISIPNNLSDKTATFNTSFFLPFEFGKKKKDTGSVQLNIDYTLNNGMSLKNPPNLFIDVVKPISIIEVPSSIVYNDTTKTNVTFKTFTATPNIIDSVKGTWRNGKEGLETEIIRNFNKAKDSIDLSNKDYINDYNLSKGDTLIYTFTASSGKLKEQVSIVLPVVPQSFKPTVESTFSSNLFENQLSLATGKVFENKSKNGDIVFNPNLSGFQSINIESYSTNIEFVKVLVPTMVTSQEYFEQYIDVEQAKVDFENGSSQSSVVALSGALYIYKITRKISISKDSLKTIDYYGILQIKETTSTGIPNSRESIFGLTLVSKENSLIAD